MKLYYKIFSTLFFALFMGTVTCFIFSIFLEKVGNGIGEGWPLLIFVAIFGLVAFLYGKMAYMRLRRIPVLELTPRALTLRKVGKRNITIPLKCITDVSLNDKGLVIRYKESDVKKVQSISYYFIDAVETDYYVLANEIKKRL